MLQDSGLGGWHTWIKAPQECTRLFLKSLQAPEMYWDPSLSMVCPRQFLKGLQPPLVQRI